MHGQQNKKKKSGLLRLHDPEKNAQWSCCNGNEQI